MAEYGDFTPSELRSIVLRQLWTVNENRGSALKSCSSSTYSAPSSPTPQKPVGFELDAWFTTTSTNSFPSITWEWEVGNTMLEALASVCLNAAETRKSRTSCRVAFASYRRCAFC